MGRDDGVRDVVVLGSTGSVGRQACELMAEHPDRFRVVALATGGGSIPVLAQQVLDHRPAVVALARPTAVQDLQLALYAVARDRGWNAGEMTLPRIVAGPDAAVELAGLECDVVLNAITGAAGLEPTLTALAAGRRLALANKESLVIGGRLVTAAAADGQIVPVDSEHSAIAQCLRGGRAAEVDRLVLTASGGPFRGRSRAELTDVTPAQAMAHPTWDMGRVITTNSATLVNKGLEVLEAHLLFGLGLDRIDVVVHPQSVVHSMVQFTDGSTLAQCSPPDMRLPIALGLVWPDRLPGSTAPVDWSRAASWTFEPLDSDAFPAVELARRAGLAGGSAPAVLNAANEECVDAFHEGRIGFLQILDLVTEVLTEHLGPTSAGSSTSDPVGDRSPVRDGGVGSSLVPDQEMSVAAVLAADAWARNRTATLVGRGSSAPTGPEPRRE